jgi:hypothetical protein
MLYPMRFLTLAVVCSIAGINLGIVRADYISINTATSTDCLGWYIGMANVGMCTRTANGSRAVQCPDIIEQFATMLYYETEDCSGPVNSTGYLSGFLNCTRDGGPDGLSIMSFCFPGPEQPPRPPQNGLYVRELVYNGGECAGTINSALWTTNDTCITIPGFGLFDDASYNMACDTDNQFVTITTFFASGCSGIPFSPPQTIPVGCSPGNNVVGSSRMLECV